MTDAKLTVVIFGAGGFIGATLDKLLRAKGHMVVALSRQECDMLDPGSVQQALERVPAPYSVVHAACLNRHEQDDFGALTKNVAMVENFTRSVRPGAVRCVVYLSSTDVYGDAPVTPITENTLLAPGGYYALSKYNNESLLMRSGQLDCPVTVLRLPGIFGPHDRGRSILGMFARKVMRGELITIFGDGSTRRDFVLVNDLCEIIRRFLICPVPAVFNVANGRSMELMEILQILSALSGKNLNVIMAAAGVRSNDLVFNVTRLQEALGDMRMTPFEEGARRLLDFLNHKNEKLL
jgi:UDP-glucose 4-epimerase